MRVVASPGYNEPNQMLRKSLQVLVFAALVALASTLVYAALALAGPDEAIAAAEATAARGELARAIAALGVAERDVRDDPQRTQTVLRLRSEWQTRLGRYGEALNDVRKLVAAAPQDEDLRLTEIRLLALAGDGEGARSAAEAFLAAHPGHGRGLELAGEAGQTLYQPQLRALRARLERDLPLGDRDAARLALGSYLYRPELDPAVATAHERLAALHAGDPRLQTAWPATAEQLRTLRAQVQPTLDRFRDSLEAPGEPVAAFRAVALALDQSQRRDDLLAQCEIHRRRFTHAYVDDAGAAAAWSLLRQGRDAAVRATVDRWITWEVLDQRVAAKPIGVGTLELLMARTLAAFRLGDTKALELSSNQSGRLWREVTPTPATMPFCFAFHQEAKGAFADAEHSFKYAFHLLAPLDVPVDRPDLLPMVAEGLLRTLDRRGAAEADVQSALGSWLRARPQTTAPILANAALQARLARPLAAAAAYHDALAIRPDDDATFAAYVAMRRAEAEATGRDGATLLRQAIERRAKLPEVSDPTGYLMCAEAALAIGDHLHALGCARAAMAAFPRARAPQALAVRCLLAAGDAAEAARSALRLLAEHAPEPATVALALTAFAAADRSPREALPRALATAGSPQLQTALLEQALADAPALAHRFVNATVLAPDAPAELQLLGATALAQSGDAARALGLLATGLANAQRATSVRAGLRTRAIATWLQAAAGAGVADAELADLTATMLAAATTEPPAALRPLGDVAGELAASRPRTAALLYADFFARAAAADRRGADYVHAGSAAARAGDWRLAEDRWTAALGFADGRAAAGQLARLAVLTERPERGRQALAAGDGHDCIGLALRLGDEQLAVKLAAAALEADRGDLLAHCARALRGQPAPIDWQRAFGDLGALCSEALVALHDDALAGLALPKLDLLLQLAPKSTANRLLRARALAATGRATEAAELHAALLAEGFTDLVLLREVARAGADPAYTLAPAVQQKLFEALIAGGLTSSPPTLAFAVQRFQDAFRRGGFPGVADQVVATAWQTVAPPRPLGSEDVAAIVAHSPPDAALRTLWLALATPTPAAARARAIDGIAAACERLAAGSAASRSLALATARERLAVDEAAGDMPGRLLHFLLAQDKELDAARRLAWLRRHLEAVATGRDDAANLPATVRELLAAKGLADTRALVDESLAAHPTSLALWLARTELAIAAGDGANAVPMLGAVVAHCDAPEAILQQIVLAAEADLVDADADRRHAALPAALRDGPLGRYAKGMLALRSGRPDEALPLLADAPTRPDGMHLFAHALAALQSRGKDGPEVARARFQALQRDYPSSSLARNAGRFANQLAPR